MCRPGPSPVHPWRRVFIHAGLRHAFDGVAYVGNMMLTFLTGPLQVIQKKRAEKPEVRQASREAALRYDAE